MPSKGSITKTIRFNVEDREYIERVMEEEEVTWSGAIHKLIEDRGTPHKEDKGNSLKDNMEDTEYKDLENMCQVSRLSIKEFMGRVVELFNLGNIYIDGTEVKTKGEYDTRELEDMCHRINADPQDMIDRLTRSLLKG